MPEVGRVFKGVPAAERSAQRRGRLLDAGLELFGTRGVAGVTVGEICDEAALTKRYFYEHFESIDAFIDALMEDIVERLTKQVVSDAPGQSSQRTRVAAFVSLMTADRRVARLVFVETFGASGSLTRLRHRLVHRGVETMIAEFLPPDVVSHGATPSVQMTAYALSGACAELLLAWLEGDLQATTDEVVDYLVALFASATELISLA